MKEFDVCVIGAGPGGYVAAINAGRTGAKVAIIEKEFAGGTCLNTGCIPTKTLLASAEALSTAKHAADFGVKVDGEVSFDWTAMQDRKTAVIEKLRQGINGLLTNANVEILTGTAEFINKNEIKVNGENEEVIKANKTIIATGSQTFIPGFIPQGKRVLNSTDLLSIEEVPKSMIVLGGGVIGCEFASLFSELGTQVTIVEMLGNILPTLDTETAKTLAREFKKKKIKIMTGKALENIQVTDEGVTGIVGKKELSAEYLLVSIGRKPVTEGLNIEATGLKADERGFIQVNNKCQTSVDGIYAIGDVTGRIQLAHLASSMAIVAAENACGNDISFDDNLVPSCIFTHPEIGSVGLSEEQCKEQDIEYNVGKFPFAALGKAMAINETAGFTKIVADAKTDEVLGVHIIGPHATDLISEAGPVIQNKTTAAELGKVIHAHPTLGEAIMEAAHAVHGKCAHIPKLKGR